ncbi:MAG TPA: thiamine pyrophosphate-dependent enzyme, partial [Rubricoccaceae bacterium]
MASENSPDLPADDRRPSPSDAGRYTTRTFLSPETDAPAGDGATAPSEALADAAPTESAAALDAGQLRAALEADAPTATDEAPAAEADGAPDALAGSEGATPAEGLSSEAAPVGEELVDAETSIEDDEDITEDIDAAFEEEVDPGKADVPAPTGFEGDLEVTPLTIEDVGAETLMACLRTMMTSRRLDEKMLTLLKQGKGYFHIGSSGHEATQTALGRAFVGGHDAFCFYYRDLSTALSVGMTVEEILRAHFGKAADPNGGGRQMPEHFGHRELNILSTSSSVGAQYLPAVGFALAHRRDAAAAEKAGEPALDTPKAVYVSGGEGSTSQGAFHEGLNWAARESLPVIFHIQDNGYAISVPVR